MKKLFNAFWIALRKIENAIMIVSAILLVTLVITQVLLRYIFKMPLMGVEELACMAGFWMYMLGAASGARERNHIRADLMRELIKNDKTYHTLQTFISFITFLLACTMTNWCWNYVSWSLVKRELSPALMIPMYYAQFSLFVAALLMSFYFFIECIDHAVISRGRAPLTLPNVDDTSTSSEV